jgi:hypothetical protein
MGTLPIDHHRGDKLEAISAEVRAGLANGLKPNFRSTGKMPVGLTGRMPVLPWPARSTHLPFLRKAEKAIANESWSQISRVRLAIAWARNRGLPKPGKEKEDDEAGNETGKSETGAGTD